MDNVFQNNLSAVYFIYGLAFYTMGLVVLMQHRSYSTFRLSEGMAMLAAFGLLYGLGVWGHVFIPFQVPSIVGGMLWKVAALQVLFEGTAFFFLFLFGARMMGLTKSWARWLTLVPPIVFSIWLVVFTATMIRFLTQDLLSGITYLETLARYTLAFPGAIVSAYGLFLQREELASLRDKLVSRSLDAAILALFLEALFGGLVVPPADLWPANVMNTLTFEHWFGISVGIPRAFTGMILTLAMTKVLGAFDLERERRLSESWQRQAILEERDRLGRDLHDGVLQQVFAMGLNLKTLAKTLSQDPGNAGKVEDLVTRMDDVVKDIRGYITGLQPRLEGSDWSRLINGLADEYRRDTSLNVSVVVDDHVKLDTEATYHLYHIVREALTNAARHAQASRVAIEIGRSSNSVFLRVSDDGQGLGQIDESREHFGLANMQARASRLGGRLFLTGSSLGGTEVRLVFPMVEKNLPPHPGGG